jgi:hypothetical protein
LGSGSIAAERVQAIIHLFTAKTFLFYFSLQACIQIITKPGDDADKINYIGETKIINYISGIVLSPTTTNQKLAFTKTRETQTLLRCAAVV